MSYAFGMFFKQLSKKEDAFQFVNEVKNTMNENVVAFFNQNVDRYIFPSLSSGIKEKADEYWVKSAFTMRFVYWPQEHLVGLSGYEYPDKVKSMFDTHFCFQNSTDQDYEFEEWSSAIDLFDRNKQAFMSKGIETLYYQGYVDRFYTLDDLLDDPVYYKKTCLYDKIYTDLKLDDWLWEKQNDSFISLNVNPVSEHNRLTISLIMDKQYKKSIGEDASLEDKMIEHFLKEDHNENEDELEK